MSGDWIKMRVDLGDDPAVFALAARLKKERDLIVGKLHRFWSWADRHAVDGRVAGGSAAFVDDIVGLKGFAAGMAAVGWLVVEADAVVIPRYARHNGDSAKERGLKSARQARWRDKRTPLVDAPPSTSVDAPPSTSASTSPSTREEKRREELNSGTAERVSTSEASQPPPLSLPRQFSLPEDWRDEALRLRPEWLPDDALRVFLNFRDHFAGSGVRREDWRPAWLKWVRNERGAPLAKGKREPTLAEKRAANMDVICGRSGNGRDIEGAASRVDSPAVRALPGDLRQSGDDDVGGRQPVRIAAGLG